MEVPSSAPASDFAPTETGLDPEVPALAGLDFVAWGEYEWRVSTYALLSNKACSFAVT
jgi:hypothetical protein